MYGILGGTLAWKDGEWDTVRWLAVLMASFFVHLNTNLANDYFEFFSATDEGEAIGGSRVLQEGKISPRQIRIVMTVLYTLAFILGIWLLLASKAWYLAVAMLFAFFSSLFYTAPPIKYGYHSLGELFVCINMGPIMVAGTYTALTGRYSLDSVVISLPIALMVALVLYYQSLPDIKTDESVGKITLSVRLGRKYALCGYRLLVLLSILSIILLVAIKLIHFMAIASLLTVLLAAKIDKMMQQIPNWQDLHGRGGKVRVFYLINGIIVITSVVFKY